MKHFIPLFLSVLVLGGAIAGYLYMLGTINAGIAAIAVARDDIVGAGQREAFARTASAFLRDTADVRSELDSFIAQDADFVSVIETVEASALREGVSASVGSVSVKTGQSKFHEDIVMTLSVTGAFPDVTSFIASLETFPVASRVTQVSLESATRGDWFGTIMLEFVKRKTLL